MTLRWFAAMIAILVGACGGGSSILDDYDPAEVAYLRSQAGPGAEVEDEVLASTLEFRLDCRTVKAYTNALSRGTVSESDPAWLAFANVVSRFEERGQPLMASHFRGVVASARLGDPSPALEFLNGNCQDPPGTPGGIDGVA